MIPTVGPFLRTDLGASGSFGPDARHQVVTVAVGVVTRGLLAFGHDLRLGDRRGFGSALRVAGVQGRHLLG